MIDHLLVKRTHTQIPTYIHTHTYIPTYRHTYIPTYLLYRYLPTYVPRYLRACIPTYLDGKRLTECRLEFQPSRVHFVCVFSRSCDDLCLGLFFDSVKSRGKLLFLKTNLCVRLPSLCCTCVSGLESNFYRHHLGLRKVATF